MRSVATAVALGAAAAAAAQRRRMASVGHATKSTMPPKARKHETTEHLSSSELRNLALRRVAETALPGRADLSVHGPADLLERAIHGVRLKKGGEWTRTPKCS